MYFCAVNCYSVDLSSHQQDCVILLDFKLFLNYSKLYSNFEMTYSIFWKSQTKIWGKKTQGQDVYFAILRRKSQEVVQQLLKVWGWSNFLLYWWEFSILAEVKMIIYGPVSTCI